MTDIVIQTILAVVAGASCTALYMSTKPQPKQEKPVDVEQKPSLSRHGISYTKEEDEAILACKEGDGSDIRNLALLIGRTEVALLTRRTYIRNQSRKRNKSGTAWTKDDEEYIWRNRNRRVSGIAKKLGRSRSATYQALHRIRKTKRKERSTLTLSN